MHPEFFGSIPAYAVFLVAGDLVGIVVAVSGAHRAGLKAGGFAIALVIVTVAALVGAKFYGLIERGGGLGSLGSELFSSYRYPGGVIAVAAALLLIGRWGSIPAGLLADVIAPAFGFAKAAANLGKWDRGAVERSGDVRTAV